MKIREAGGTLTIEMYFRMSDGKYGQAFGIGLVLLVIVLAINFITKWLAARFDVNRKDRDILWKKKRIYRRTFLI